MIDVLIVFAVACCGIVYLASIPNNTDTPFARLTATAAAITGAAGLLALVWLYADQTLAATP